jgi:Uma2 family endonuclease
MSTLVNDPALSARLISQRRAHGADLFDEVWEGVYVMAPAPNDEHQSIATRLARVLVEVIEDAGLGNVRNTINLAATHASWEHDYRVPDLAVFLRGSSAVCHGAFWTGGPDLVIEIVSPFDQTRDKLDFYETVGVRELLIIDRDPWQLDLLRLVDGRLSAVSLAPLGGPTPVFSESIGLTFRLVAAHDRPEIVVTHARDGRHWIV